MTMHDNRLSLAGCTSTDMRDIDTWWYELENAFDVLATDRMSEPQIAAMLADMRKAVEAVWQRHSIVPDE